MGEKFHYEFGGPIGTFFVIIGLPFVIYLLFFLCNDKVCLRDPSQFDFKEWYEKYIPSFDALFSYEATIIYLGWMLFHVLLERILPGEAVEGTVLPNKQRLQYTMSGHLQFWVCLIVMGHGFPIISERVEGVTAGWCSAYLPDDWSKVFQLHGFSSLPLYLAYDYYLQLITISIIFTFLFSVYL